LFFYKKCIQAISQGASIKVLIGKKFRVPGNLIVHSKDFKEKIIAFVINLMNMEEKLLIKTPTQLEANTLTTAKEETLSQRLKNLPYSTDRIGKGFVMHLPQPKRETKDTQRGNI